MLGPRMVPHLASVRGSAAWAIGVLPAGRSTLITSSRPRQPASGCALDDCPGVRPWSEGVGHMAEEPARCQPGRASRNPSRTPASAPTPMAFHGRSPAGALIHLRTQRPDGYSRCRHPFVEARPGPRELVAGERRCRLDQVLHIRDEIPQLAGQARCKSTFRAAVDGCRSAIPRGGYGIRAFTSRRGHGPGARPRSVSQQLRHRLQLLHVLCPD